MDTALTREEQNRYSRHILLSEIGEQGQQRLKAAKVLVIGAGGLGCPVLQYLAAAGVGTIGIIDFDKIEESNLQRQVLYTTQDVGRYKAIAAQERLEALNPLLEIAAYTDELTPQNALELFAKYDIIVDGSDNFATRYLVNDACVILDKPLVYGSIFKFEGQVAVFNYQGSATYRCLFATPPPAGSVPNCSEIGVLGVLPAIIGSMQANECLKLILQIGEPLANQLLIYNTLQNNMQTLALTPNTATIATTKAMQADFEKTNYQKFCGLENIEKDNAVAIITATELNENLGDYTLIDVRELYEQPRPERLTAINIPLPRLLMTLDQIPKGKAVVMICQKGIRSRIAIETLQNKFGYTNLINLQGGVLQWEREVGSIN